MGADVDVLVVGVDGLGEGSGVDEDGLGDVFSGGVGDDLAVCEEFIRCC